ncbi:MAG: flagellar hook-associated protein FlgL, partial [Paracoccaceae bacterium]
MPISTKLFNEQTLRSFGVMTDRTAELQKQVSTGKKNMRPSKDAVGAVQLSAAKELRSSIGRYEKNLDISQNRLDLADSTLNGVQNIITRLVELSMQAANDTLAPQDRQSIKSEVEQAREALMSIVNTRDSQGQALFGGYRTTQTPFVQGADGKIVYQGDGGQTSVKVSDSHSLSTAIDGGTAFMEVQTSQGPQSVFDLIDNFVSALDKTGQTVSRAKTVGAAALTFTPSTEPVSHSFKLTGPN